MATFTLIKQDRHLSQLLAKSAQYLLGTALFALFLLAPTFNSQAHAAAEVTKTITVLLPDGVTPASNVKVAIYIAAPGDPVGSHFAIDSTTSLTTVLTNSSGVATITTDLGQSWTNLIIQPNSQYSLQSLWVPPTSDSLTTTLENSTAVFRIGHKKNNPSDPFAAAETGSVISWPSAANPNWPTDSRVIDASNFGLAFIPNVTSSQVELSMMQIFSTTYMSSAIETEGRFSVETDAIGYPTINQGAITAQAGVFTLNFAAPAVTGTLKRTDGSQLNLPVGVNYSVRLIGFTNGSLDMSASLVQQDGYVDPVTGNWGLTMYTNGATQQLLQFVSQGSLKEFPTFFANPATGSIWVNTATPPQFSNNNAEFSAPLTGVITNIPSPANVGFSIVASATAPVPGAPLTGYFQIYKASPTDPTATFLTYVDTSAGTTSLILPDGMYHVFFYPNNQDLIPTDFMIAVEGPTVMVGTSPQNIFTPESDGSYKIVSSEPNLVIQIIDPRSSLPVTSPESEIISICIQAGGQCAWFRDIYVNSVGKFSTHLNAGSYVLTIVGNPGIGGLTDTEFMVTVDDMGVATVT